LRDLTVIHGPNGSGKSYSASAVYSILNSIRQSIKTISTTNEEINFIKKWISGLDYEKEIKISDYTHKFLLDFIFNSLFKNPSELFYETFGCRPVKLINHKKNTAHISMIIGENKLNFNFDRINSEIKLTVVNKIKPNCKILRKKTEPKPKKVKLDEYIPSEPICKDDVIIIDDNYSVQRVCEIINRKYLDFYLKNLIIPSVYYLPASRTGIMQFHEAAIEYSVRSIKPTKFKSQPMQINRDFLYFFYSSPSQRIEDEPLDHINELLEKFEKRVLTGKIERKEDHLKSRFEYQIRLEKLELGLLQSSSLITEITPMIVYLKYHLNRKDILIIEEPEAHLNLKNQWLLAKILVGCVREGIKIVVITHSHYLISRFNNFILSSQLSPKNREKSHLVQKDYLLPEEVVVNEFKQVSDESNQYEIINYDATSDGINFNSFNDVIEELSNEYHLIMDFLEKKK